MADPAIFKHSQQLVLASASSRRLMLLDRTGLRPDLLNPSDIDETPLLRETPRKLSLRLAEAKAKKAQTTPIVQALGRNVYIVAADTVVGLGRRVLPKAETRQEGEECLELLSGRAHHVYTTVCVVAPNGALTKRCVESKIRMKRLSSEEIQAYLACDEWRGKAGAYAIQGRAEAFFRYMSGSYSAIVGLPLYETVMLLSGAGYDIAKAWGQKPPKPEE